MGVFFLREEFIFMRAKIPERQQSLKINPIYLFLLLAEYQKSTLSCFLSSTQTRLVNGGPISDTLLNNRRSTVRHHPVSSYRLSFDKFHCTSVPDLLFFNFQSLFLHIHLQFSAFRIREETR